MCILGLPRRLSCLHGKPLINWATSPTPSLLYKADPVATLASAEGGCQDWFCIYRPGLGWHILKPFMITLGSLNYTGYSCPRHIMIFANKIKKNCKLKCPASWSKIQKAQLPRAAKGMGWWRHLLCTPGASTNFQLLGCSFHNYFSLLLPTRF